MKTPQILFEGNFQMWTFDVSHARLLFRKQVRKAGEKRVDILFSGVRFMQVATFFDSIRIDEVWILPKSLGKDWIQKVPKSRDFAGSKLL